MADRDNFIITGNATAASNQYTGGGGGFIPLPGQAIQYGRVVTVNLQDRSITYEIIQNNLGVSALNKPNKITGIAHNFNPNFTRLPQIGELVPLIPGPNNRVGNLANQYDQVLYYILGAISSQVTVNDNKVPQELNSTQTDYNKNYKVNDIGFVQSSVGQIIPSITPTPTNTPTPSPTPTNTPTPTPGPTPTPTPTSDPRGTFRENYTNRAGNEFELFSKKSGFNTTIYAYKKGTTTLLVTGSPSSTNSIENLLREMKLTLQDNVYP